MSAQCFLAGSIVYGHRHYCDGEVSPEGYCARARKILMRTQRGLSVGRARGKYGSTPPRGL